MTSRPQRKRVINELGQDQTLPEGIENFSLLGRGGAPLILGLGPEPALAAKALGDAGHGPVRYVECPDFAEAMDQGWEASVPGNFTRVKVCDLTDHDLASSTVLAYWPGMRLYPSFWGPVAGRCRWLRIAAQGPAARENSVLIPAARTDLLAPEVCMGFAQAGLDVRLADPAKLGEQLPRLLAETRPKLFFSINFGGLDPHGEVFNLLEAAGVPVAVWCVDNPWHLVSGLRSPFWKKARLMVTDSWFMDPLVAHGAEFVMHLPLAAWPEMFNNPAPCGEKGLEDRLVFVGRSEFPQKHGYFAGCQVPEDVAARAGEDLLAGGRPDYAWWVRELGLDFMWPGREARRAGFGAEQCSRAWRIHCLRGAANLPLTIYGDDAWAGHLPDVKDLRGLVDYYGPLAGIYARSAVSLNLTSLLLPSGLTQRHFDVWAAGGFLLTDRTPGLSLFPDELAEPVSFARAGDLPGLAEKYLADASARADLSRAWKDLILAEHTYDRRMERVLNRLELGS